MATQAELRQNAQRIFERLRMNLLQSLQVGNPRTFAHGNPRSNLAHRSPYSQVNQGLSLQNGRMPNDAEIAAYVQQQPEYRKAVRAIEKSGGRGSGSRGGQVSSGVGNIPQPGPSEAMGLYNNWLAKQQAGFDEAKAANEARYKEGHGELTGVRDFRQDKYQNFGVAAQQDIDERMQETLKNIRAQAASRGLSNSNVPLAFEQRTARDTAREQQRVREMRDSRMADAYAQDTGNLVGFIERREDPYPDMNQALQLGIQLAGSEADRQAQSERLAAMERMYRGTGGRGRSDVRLPPVPGPQGGVVPYFVNGTPLQMANAYFAGGGPRLGVASNRYPTRRTPEEYAAVRQSQRPTLSPTISLPGSLPEEWMGNATMQPTLAPAPRPPKYLPPNWNGGATLAPTPINTYFGF